MNNTDMSLRYVSSARHLEHGLKDLAEYGIYDSRYWPIPECLVCSGIHFTEREVNIFSAAKVKNAFPKLGTCITRSNRFLINPLSVLIFVYLDGVSSSFSGTLLVSPS